MALINSKGNYLKVKDLSFDTSELTYDIYVSEDHRKEGDNDFVKHTTYKVVLGFECFANFTYSKTKGLVDSIKTFGYKELLKLEEFKEWESKI